MSEEVVVGGGTHDGTDPLDKPWLKALVEETLNLDRFSTVGDDVVSELITKAEAFVADVQEYLEQVRLSSIRPAQFDPSRIDVERIKEIPEELEGTMKSPRVSKDGVVVEFSDRLKFRNLHDGVMTIVSRPCDDGTFVADVVVEIISGVNVDEDGLLVPCSDACAKFERMIQEERKYYEP